jgi:hypothetical protein
MLSRLVINFKEKTMKRYLALAALILLTGCSNPNSGNPAAPVTQTPTVTNDYTLMFVAGAQSSPTTFEVYDSYPSDYGGVGHSWGPPTGTQGVTNIIYSGTASAPITYDWSVGAFISPVTIQCFALKNGVVINSSQIVAPISGTQPKFQGTM